MPAASRDRLVDATREQLLDPRGLVAFTVDAVAKRAGVSRQTVYNQFATKAALLDAVCDDAASASGLSAALPVAFAQPDPVRALSLFVEAFGGFWSTEPDLTRRMQGLRLLEPDYAAVLDARDERRLTGLGVLVDRFTAPAGFGRSAKRRQLVRTLQALTAFATFDQIAGPGRAPRLATAAVTALALGAVASAGLTGG